MSDASQHPAPGPWAAAGYGPAADPAATAPDEPGAAQPYGWEVDWPARPRAPRRPGRAAAIAAVVVLAVAAAGVPFGLLWSAVAPSVPVRMTDDGAVLVDTQPEEFAAAEGWFALLGFGFGVLAAVVVWRLAARWRGPLVLAALALGAAGAGLIAWWVGSRLGEAEYERLLDEAPVGAVFARPVDLRAADADLLFGFLPMVSGDVLVPALCAAVAYTLLAGWSRYSTLRPHEEPEPYPVDPFATPPPFPTEPVSWGSTATPAPPAAPEPPEPGAAGPPRG